MTRILIAALAAALLAGAIGLTAIQPAAAQQGPPSVCLSLPPGEHSFTAPSQDRDGEVTFTVTIGEGGQVTAFTEPGGQSIPPAALRDIFMGDDAYPLPEGVAFIECEAADDSMMEADDSAGQAAEVCLNLEPGTYEETINAAGQSVDIIINVGAGNRIVDVIVFGDSYSGAAALELLNQYGATLPAGLEIVPCQAAPTLYPNGGSGGLADGGSADRSGLWAALGGLAAFGLVAGVAARRRVSR